MPDSETPIIIKPQSGLSLKGLFWVLIMAAGVAAPNSHATKLVSDVADVSIDEHLPDGLHIKGEIKGRYFIKGALYFQMQLVDLYVEGYRHPKTNRYYSYNILESQFGSELAPREIMGGKFDVDMLVMDSTTGKSCFSTPWHIRHMISVNVGRKSEITTDLVGSLMGEYTEAEKSDGSPPTKEEYNWVVDCLHDPFMSRSIHIQRLEISEAYFPIPNSLTPYADHFAGLLDTKSKQEAAEKQATEEKNTETTDTAPLDKTEVATSGGAGQTEKATKDNATKSKDKKEDSRDQKSAGKSSRSAAMTANLEYASAVSDARAAEARGDDRAALQAWKRANSWKPSAETQRMVSQFQLKNTLNSAGDALGRALVEASRNRAERFARERQEELERRDDAKEAHREKWTAARDKLNAFLKKVGYTLTGDSKYIEPPKVMKSWAVTTLKNLTAKDLVYGPEQIVAQQRELPADQRLDMLHVFGLQIVTKNHMSDAAYNTRHSKLHLSSTPSVEQYRDIMALPTADIRLTPSAHIPLKPLIDAPIENLYSAIVTALDPQYPMETENMLVVATADKEMMNQLRAMLTNSSVDGVSVVEVRGNTGDLTQMLRAGIGRVVNVEQAMEELLTGKHTANHALELSDDRNIYFWKDRFMTITTRGPGAELASGDQLSPSAFYDMYFYSMKKKMPALVNFAWKDNVFTPDWKKVAPRDGWAWKGRSGLYPLTYQSRDYLAVQSLNMKKLTKDGRYVTCTLAYEKYGPEAIRFGHYSAHASNRGKYLKLNVDQAAWLVPCISFTPKKAGKAKVRLRLPDRNFSAMTGESLSTLRLFAPVTSTVETNFNGKKYRTFDWNYDRQMLFDRRTRDGIYGWHAKKKLKLTVYRKEDVKYFWKTLSFTKDNDESKGHSMDTFIEKKFKDHWRSLHSSVYGTSDEKILKASQVNRVIPNYSVTLTQGEKTFNYTRPQEFDVLFDAYLDRISFWADTVAVTK